MITARTNILKIYDSFLGPYLVEVFGDEPYDYVRRYSIHAKDRDAACAEAIQMFTVEMEALIGNNSPIV
jgi:hypothetical protein